MGIGTYCTDILRMLYHGTCALWPWSKQFRHRYAIVFLCFMAICICYADRSNLSIAIIPMSKEFGWDASTKGVILSSFFYGYILTQALGGYLSDRLGGKYILAIGSILWSLFTILTPFSAKWMHHLAPLIVCRVLMGLGEGVAFPAVHSIISRWIPKRERSSSVSIVTSASYMGSALALLLSPPLADAPSLGWPWIFYVFGGLGLLWNVPWQLFGTSYPSQKKSLSDAEWQEIHADTPTSVTESSVDHPAAGFKRLKSTDSLADVEAIIEANQRHMSRSASQEPFMPNGGLGSGSPKAIGADSPSPLASASDSTLSLPKRVTPVWLILRTPAVWAILINQFTNSWGSWIILSWLPTYYEERFHLTLPDVGLYTLLAYLLQGLCGILVGFAGDWLIAKGLRVIYLRKGAQALGMLGTAACYLGANQVTQPWHAMALITLGQAVNTLTLVGVSVSQLDIAPHDAGFIFGLGNTAATLPGIIAVSTTGWILDATGHNWGIVFGIAAINYVVGAIVWLFLAKAEVLIP